jgi:hypothetical protein
MSLEQLLGGKMFVQGMEADLKRLAPPEAAQVFEAVRGRIIGGDVFDVEPPGIAGLVALVKAQPTLQVNLLDFLEGLPTDNLGPWVVKGWEGVIRDGDAQGRLDRLMITWASSGKNIMLKTTAARVAKFDRGAR